MRQFARTHAQGRIDQLNRNQRLSRYRLDVTLTERAQRAREVRFVARILVVDQWRKHFRHIVNATASATPKGRRATPKLKSRLIRAALDKAIEDAITLARTSPRYPDPSKTRPGPQLSMVSN